MLHMTFNQPWKKMLKEGKRAKTKHKNGDRTFCFPTNHHLLLWVGEGSLLLFISSCFVSLSLLKYGFSTRKDLRERWWDAGLGLGAGLLCGVEEGLLFCSFPICIFPSFVKTMVFIREQILEREREETKDRGQDVHHTKGNWSSKTIAILVPVHTQ